MTIKPSPLFLISTLVLIIFANAIAIAFFDFRSILHLLCMFVMNLIVFYFSVIQVKLFTLKDGFFIVKYPMLSGIIKDEKYELKDINLLTVKEYSWQNRISPVIKIQSRMGERKISFRFEDKKDQFQLFINELRENGVRVDCEGDVWR